MRDPLKFKKCYQLFIATNGKPTATQRITHPVTHGFPDAGFDYLFTKG